MEVGVRDSVRRRLNTARISFLVAGAGLAAGLGIGRAGEPPTVDADAAASNIITINGNNIANGSVRLRDLNKKDVDKRYLTRNQSDHIFLKIRNFAKSWDAYLKMPAALAAFDAFLKLDGTAKAFDAFLKLEKLEAFDSFIKIQDADKRYLKESDASAGYLKLDAAAKDAVKLGGQPADAYIKGRGQIAQGSRLVNAPPLKMPQGDAETALSAPDLLTCSFSWGVSNSVGVHLTNTSGKLMTVVPGGDVEGGGPLEPGEETTLRYTMNKSGRLLTVVQIIQGAPGDDTPRVHTLTVSGFMVDDDADVANGAPQAQVSGQILIGL
jgi:hypothetical protein